MFSPFDMTSLSQRILPSVTRAETKTVTQQHLKIKTQNTAEASGSKMSHRLSSNNYNHSKSTNEVVFTYTSSLER